MSKTSSSGLSMVCVCVCVLRINALISTSFQPVAPGSHCLGEARV